jgi:hypothetical protein
MVPLKFFDKKSTVFCHKHHVCVLSYTLESFCLMGIPLLKVALLAVSSASRQHSVCGFFFTLDQPELEVGSYTLKATSNRSHQTRAFLMIIGSFIRFFNSIEKYIILCVINCFRIFSPKLELQKDSPTQRFNS